MRTVAQGAGRGFRAASDFCVTWILDGNFAMLHSKVKGEIPAWWAEAIVWKTAKLKEVPA